MPSAQKCHFCDSTVTAIDSNHQEQNKHIRNLAYQCPICGWISLVDDFLELISLDRASPFSPKDKLFISIVLRNEHERRGGIPPNRALTVKQLNEIAKQYRELDALEKMDKALENLDKKSLYIGEDIIVDHKSEFPYYHCRSPDELISVLRFLLDGYLITSSTRDTFTITAKGYERLRELKSFGKDSRQCFVAMWFTPDMGEVYEKVIRPAIEYVEKGQSEPRFKALKIDQKEHTNDVNDEIISEIRRSRFMVCDLTGYRGGVYWEAGFCYGLGLEVIYTCREDRIKPFTEKFALSDGTEREIKKEGIHFDLEHRNRIEWKDSNLDDFKDRLTNRIKAVIV